MKHIIKDLDSGWYRAEPASEDDIQEVARNLGVRFPDDYVGFLMWSNGGEGSVGTSYISLWPIEEIELLNSDYQINKYLPGLIGIGTDGGGECYALDYRANDNASRMIQVPLGDLSEEAIIDRGASFEEFLQNALKARA